MATKSSSSSSKSSSKSSSITSGKAALNAKAASAASSAPKVPTFTVAYAAAKKTNPGLTPTQFQQQNAGKVFGAPTIRKEGNTTRIASPEEIQARNLASSVRTSGGDEAAQAVYKAAGVNPNDPNTAPSAVNIKEAQRVADEFKAAAQKSAPEVYTGKSETYTAPEKKIAKAEELDSKIASKEDKDVMETFSQSLKGGNMNNPFDEGTESYNVFEQMKGILNPLVQNTAEMKKRREDEAVKGKEFISSEAQLKNDILSRQLATGETRKQADIEKIRARGRLAEMNVEEGRKKALRYLRGALAQRGALGTTGTGAFNVSALTAQYDIKNADLKQAANEQVSDVETKFQDLTTQIQNNQLLNESEKAKLMLELDRTTANAIDALMNNLANQQVQLGGQAFSIARQNEAEAAARKRADARATLDYLMKRRESGEYVDQKLIDKIVAQNPDLSDLVGMTGATGRENISKAVSNEYVNLLGADWTTKVNPNTGKTYKEGLTDLVVKDVNNGATLTDALAKVRSAIQGSAEFKKLQAAKFAVSTGGGGGGGSGGKPTAIKYFKSGNERGVEFLDSATGQPYWSLNGSAPQPGKLPQYIEAGNQSQMASWQPDTSAAESLAQTLQSLANGG